MKAGRAFELFVKHLLTSIGFSEVKSDGIYVFDGAPGKMIQGLGEAHNADVLLVPPVQTPFFTRTRLLIECKDYQSRVGLNTIRSALGLREDINHFEMVDVNELLARRRQNRRGSINSVERYSYQVAVAALKGFTLPAQKFAATHRIPLLEFDKLPFWGTFCEILDKHRFSVVGGLGMNHKDNEQISEEELIRFADEVGCRMAVGVTNSGQLLFLYHTTDGDMEFDNQYSLRWNDPKQPWELESGTETYLFQLPKGIFKLWVENASDELELKKGAIECKANYFSNMVVYYSHYGMPTIKMISIDRWELERAKEKLK